MTDTTSPFHGLVAEDRLRELWNMNAGQLRQVLAMPSVQKAVHEKAGFLLAKLLERYRIEHYQGHDSDFWRVKQAPRWLTVAKFPSRAACVAYLAANGCDASGNLLQDPGPEVSAATGFETPTASVASTPTPTGSHPSAQGCAPGATLGALAKTALNPERVPSLRSADPDAITSDFKKAFDLAQGAVKVIAAFGVFAAHVKYNLLKHGQFGDWVTAHFGQESYRSVRAHMQLAEGILDKSGVKSLKDFVSKWQSLPICHRGEFLLAEENAVPEPVRKVRTKALEVMANKTAHQLFLDFKQAKEDAQTETLKPTRGRRKGEGGNSKEHLASVKAAEESARIEALEMEADKTAQWLLENADDKRLGAMSDKAFTKLFEAIDHARSYMVLVRKARAEKGQ